jgi:hypothetical protein
MAFASFVPKTKRPFTDGCAYLIITSVLPTFCVTTAGGDGTAFCAKTEKETKQDNNNKYFFIDM